MRGGARGGGALLAGLLTLAATGCGIRETDVPVDAGPAPTRASCDAPARGEHHTEIYLVCGQRVESVARVVSTEATEPSDHAEVAVALLGQLQADPEEAEKAAGFTSAVPGNLRVEQVEEGEAGRTVRLNRRPSEIPELALTQIICTFANSASLGGAGETVVLGGPAGTDTDKPHTYSCSAAMRSPEGARGLG
ncbi:hypothetical protein SAMN06297387_104201 [Streptomyces zhaozhouensis]|uniref:Sporulation and spore germination n=1 Tax=Streptomyces zhaozhouensis TaxID=1300267 RepID=A0A286DTS2_9ACTN|nr:hypothetical protein [Streptomyces zhaozhouensis]SOD62031.1 hypothetical protein SAMN06297387_104201 [Streptomyces zhaozhouensis]